MKLETLKTLAHDGNPLVITTSEDGFHRVVKGNHPAVTLQEKATREELEQILAFHPGPVIIDGDTLVRRQQPAAARAAVLRTRSINYGNEQPDQDLLPESKTMPGHLNAIAAGVACRVATWDLPNRMGYFALGANPRGHRNHRLLDQVSIQAWLEIHPEEIALLEESERGELIVPKDSPFERVLRERASRSITAILERPDVPDPCEDVPYCCSLTTESSYEYNLTPAPVAVTGQGVPVVINDWELDNGEFVSLVDALYHADAQLVPVIPEKRFNGRNWTEAPPGGVPSIVDTEFNEKNHTVIVRLDDDQRYEYPLRCLVKGRWEESLDINLAPGAEISREELADLVLRACWHDDRTQSEEEYEALAERAKLLAEHHLGDSRAAAMRELQLLADGIFPIVPTGDEPLTCTSSDGRVTVTLNPRAE